MHKENLGILHPGEMGITIALAAQNTGNEVLWTSEGRSSETHHRAQKLGLQDTTSLAKLCENCSIIICICPPSAAEEVASQVIEAGYGGLYIDANAVSPQRVMRISESMQAAGISFVDGSVIGGPAWKADTTRLYLSGKEAEKAASYFSAGPLCVMTLGESVGKASSLKMCYAAYTKGTTALLSAILAVAEANGIRDDLEKEWSLSIPGLEEDAPRRVRRVTAKAWRFIGEMEEIAATFQSVGIPGEFHQAAAEIYDRVSGYKGQDTPELSEVLDRLLKHN
jgi:3-hydroxyisobutyrate dehydrogenase-like beta-hydroxyacid dehydrogenase